MGSTKGQVVRTAKISKETGRPYWFAQDNKGGAVSKYHILWGRWVKGDPKGVFWESKCGIKWQHRELKGEYPNVMISMPRVSLRCPRCVRINKRKFP